MSSRGEVLVLGQDQLPLPENPKLGDRFVDTRHAMFYCWIPPGKFPEGTLDVELTQGFWMGQYTVTQEQYMGPAR